MIEVEPTQTIPGLGRHIMRAVVSGQARRSRLRHHVWVTVSEGRVFPGDERPADAEGVTVVQVDPDPAALCGLAPKRGWSTQYVGAGHGDCPRCVEALAKLEAAPEPPATPPALIDPRQLRERLERALVELEDHQGRTGFADTFARLGGKVDGVKLALSYLDDAERAQPAVDADYDSEEAAADLLRMFGAEPTPESIARILALRPAGPRVPAAEAAAAIINPPGWLVEARRPRRHLDSGRRHRTAGRVPARGLRGRADRRTRRGAGRHRREGGLRWTTSSTAGTRTPTRPVAASSSSRRSTGN